VEDTQKNLLKRRFDLENQIEREVALARENARKNRRVAIAALKRKKTLEKCLQQVNRTLTTLEKIIDRKCDKQ
ncbi:Charged multivesicular body protein 4c, partial [Pseudolycoriella hygida]